MAILPRLLAFLALGGWIGSMGCNPSSSSPPQVESSSSEASAASERPGDGGVDVPNQPVPKVADPVVNDKPTPTADAEIGADPTEDSQGMREGEGTPKAEAGDPTLETWTLQVLAAYPHDPGAFTQGLLWSEGILYESTGLYGRSSLRQVAPASGQILLAHELDRGHFGEGLALVGNRLIQLTWKAGAALIYDRDTLEPLGQWGYNGEGWGLAYDGESLLMSDGSARITFRSSEDFRWLQTLEVHQAGNPVPRINELEWVDGRIWANLWGEDRLIRIDPSSGAVDATLDASGLLTPGESRMVDVLNGVAYDPQSETFWLTGKFWPKIFQVRFLPPASG